MIVKQIEQDIVDLVHKHRLARMASLAKAQRIMDSRIMTDFHCIRCDEKDVDKSGSKCQRPGEYPHNNHLLVDDPENFAHMFMAYKQAQELELDWQVVGVEHHWEPFSVALDMLLRDGVDNRAGLDQLEQAGFSIVGHALVDSCYQVQIALEAPKLPACATATVTTTPTLRYIPQRLWIPHTHNSSFETIRYFAIHELRIGVEPLWGESSSSMFNASIFVENEIMLKRVVSEVGMDLSIKITNMHKTEPLDFHAVLFGIKISNIVDPRNFAALGRQLCGHS